MNIASWRTTARGIVPILGAATSALKALFDGDPSTNPDWTTTWVAIGAGWGLLVARDNKVSSEKAGANA